MAGFGEDVSMGDFQPPAENRGSPESGAEAGHTSDASVLNVPTMTPRNAEAAPEAGTDIDAGAPSARNTKVRVEVRVECSHFIRS